MDPLETAQIDGEKYGEIFRKTDGIYYFVCFHCVEYFQSADTIIEHIENVHLQPLVVKAETEAIDSLECGVLPQCDVNASDFNGFYEDDEDTSKIELTCDYCNEQSTNILSMESHMLKHSLDDQPFSCDLCHQVFKLKHLLDGHRRVVHGIIKDFSRGQLVMCPVCWQRFPERVYKYHMKQLHSQHKCSQCDQTYKQKKNLNAHIRLKHLNEQRPTYKCTECEKIFDERRLLKDHVRQAHTNEKPFFCKICEKRFHSKFQLLGHLHMHHGHEKKTYQCTDCGQVSKYPRCVRASCVKMKRSNKNNKAAPGQYKKNPKTNVCLDCGKGYYRPDSLEQHIKQGNCTKLKCNYCQGLFKNKRSLHSHITDSHSLTGFQCRHCSVKFAKKHQRHTHETKHKTGLI